VAEQRRALQRVRQLRSCAAAKPAVCEAQPREIWLRGQNFAQACKAGMRSLAR
jgi:hypothetical protein